MEDTYMQERLASDSCVDRDDFFFAPDLRQKDGDTTDLGVMWAAIFGFMARTV